MLKFAVEEVEKNHVGLVIGNQGGNFSAGANIMMLLLAAQEEEWDDINLMTHTFQQANMRLRYSSKPVVAAPYGLSLGGGCEIPLHCDKVRAAGETYMGLVEVGVGLLPGGGGTKEMTLRAMDLAKKTPDADPLVFLKKVFETIAMGKVATSAQEAKSFGFLKDSDAISMNGDRIDCRCETRSFEPRGGRLHATRPTHRHLRDGRGWNVSFQNRFAPNETRRIRFRTRLQDCAENR